MHSVAVDGSSLLAPSSTPQPHTQTPTHFSPSPRPVTKGRLSVNHSGRMQLFSWSPDKRRERHYLRSVDMTIVWMRRAHLVIGLFPYVTQPEHAHPCACGVGTQGNIHVTM